MYMFYMVISTPDHGNREPFQNKQHFTGEGIYKSFKDKRDMSWCNLYNDTSKTSPSKHYNVNPSTGKTTSL